MKKKKNVILMSMIIKIAMINNIMYIVQDLHTLPRSFKVTL